MAAKRYLNSKESVITSDKISVVIQGPVYKTNSLTRRVIASVRTHLPDAEIILSTWRGIDLQEFAVDQIIQNQDPGCFTIWNEGRSTTINVNRQIQSTRKGLEACTRPYAVKLRSDHLVIGTAFLDYFRKFPIRCDDVRLLDERVVVSSLFSRNPRSIEQFPYSPSDWFYFGKTCDLLKIWSVPFADKRIFTNGFDADVSRPAGILGFDTCRFAVEQYLWLEFLKASGLKVDCRHYADMSGGNLRLSELSIANNLIIVDQKRLGTSAPKYSVNGFDYTAGLYTHKEWQQLYKNYCDPQYKITGLFAHKLVLLMVRGSAIAVRHCRVIVKRKFPRLITPYLKIKRWFQAE